MEDLIMRKLISCEFNMDTVCVELKFSDGSMIAIDKIGYNLLYTVIAVHRLLQKTAASRDGNF